MTKQNVYLDLSSIIILSELDNRLDIFEKIERKYTILISFMNIQEIFAYKNIPKRDEVLEFCITLLKKVGNILDEPQQVLIRSYEGFFKRKESLDWGIQNGDIIEILKKPDNIPEDILIKQKNEDKKKQQCFINTAKSMRIDPRIKKIFEEKLDTYTVNEYLNFFFNDNESLYKIFQPFLKQYKMTIELEMVEEIKKSLSPWIYFWGGNLIGQYYLAFQRENFSFKKNPGISDVKQTIYLGACDTFITDDSRFKKLLFDLLNSDIIPTYEEEKNIYSIKEFINTLEEK